MRLRYGLQDRWASTLSGFSRDLDSTLLSLDRCWLPQKVIVTCTALSAKSALMSHEYDAIYGRCCRVETACQDTFYSLSRQTEALLEPAVQLLHTWLNSEGRHQLLANTSRKGPQRSDNFCLQVCPVVLVRSKHRVTSTAHTFNAYPNKMENTGVADKPQDQRR